MTCVNVSELYYGSLRTDYRSELYQHKLHDQVSQREILEEENEKREERLEKLRRLVRVEATADLERLYSKTKVSLIM